jgi:hypothetical protein
MPRECHGLGPGKMGGISGCGATLRNVAVTAPYMHDGRLVKGFTVTAAEKTDLIAFLASLTDEAFLKSDRFSNPWKH